LNGVDSNKIATFQKTMGGAMSEFRELMQANVVSWTVVAAASQGWAAKVFPDLTPAEQMETLWEAIFETT
ncbi:aminopeptidase, partial [Escherichia coli]|nr:aminopeptidase [Escherichia coli]